jgi:hypothetical protein
MSAKCQNRKRPVLLDRVVSAGEWLPDMSETRFQSDSCADKDTRSANRYTGPATRMGSIELANRFELSDFGRVHFL